VKRSNQGESRWTCAEPIEVKTPGAIPDWAGNPER
jgi:hypothetical protein